MGVFYSRVSIDILSIPEVQHEVRQRWREWYTVAEDAVDWFKAAKPDVESHWVEGQEDIHGKAEGPKAICWHEPT